MEVYVIFEDEEVKLYALNNVGATALSALLRYFVKNRTFTDRETNESIKTSTDEEIALSQYLKFRTKLQETFRFDLNNIKAIYADDNISVVHNDIEPEDLDHVALKGILQHSPDFPTCIGKYRKDESLKCKNECSKKCCDACDHLCATCETEYCKSFSCCLDEGVRCNHPCSSCNKSFTECMELYVVCCDKCMLCFNCKVDTAAELCPNEEIRKFVDTILKSRTFSLTLRQHLAKMKECTFESDDFPDCTNFTELFNYVRRSIEGVLNFLRKTKHFTQMQYDDENDRIFEVQMCSARDIKHDHYIQLYNELNALDYYSTLKMRIWPHIEHLRSRRHYLTLVARKKGRFMKKQEDFASRDVGLFRSIANQVSEQVKVVFEGELGDQDDYSVFPVRCQYKDKYQHPECNHSINVLICFHPTDGQNELPPEFGNIQSNENMQLWSAVTQATEKVLSEELHIATSYILTRWDFSVSKRLILQTTVSRETGGEFSPWEEVIVMEALRIQCGISFGTPNVEVQKQPLVFLRRDSVSLQFQIDTKTERLLDSVNYIIHRAHDFNFINL